MIVADYNTTISYLQTQTQNAWLTQALASAGVNNLDISYLDANTNDLMTAAKNLLTLTAIQSTDQDSLKKLVNTIQANFNNNQLGSTDLLNDDFWGLLALSSVKESENVDIIKQYILNHQNTDGGWSWSITGDSDSNDTAAALMALLETGLTVSTDSIKQAIDYLKTTQNADGGFGYDVASNSDSASTAWVISALNKLDIDPSTWVIGDNNPVFFLKSLEQVDGSYLWLATDTTGSALITAYTLLALSKSTYPVNYIELVTEPVVETGIDIRIEGLNKTICLASNLQAPNVLELLKTAATVCNFDYVIENTAYGLYVSSIANIAAEGMNGWSYWVNYQPAMVGAADYTLNNGDSVVWGYGGYPTYPSKLEVNNTSLDKGAELVIKAKYFDGTNWLSLNNTDIYVGTTVYPITNGQLNITMNQDGVYPVWLEPGEGYIRSSKEYITIGNGLSQTVDLVVTIEDNNGGGGEEEDYIAFSINQSSIDFGNLNPGQSAETILSLANTGKADIYIEANILGHNIFTNFTALNNKEWEDFNVSLAKNSFTPVNVELAVPSDFSEIGQHNGQLIFWAISK